MNQTLQMPFVETSMPTAIVLEWTKAPGDSFAYGDRLCIIVVEEVLFLTKATNANKLTASKPRRAWKRHRVYAHPVGSIRIEVVAAEPGIMRDHIVEIGGSAKIGEVLAVLQTSDDDYVPTARPDLGDLPPLRVVANHADDGGD